MKQKIILPATLPHHRPLSQLLNSLAEKAPVRHVYLSRFQASDHPFLIIHPDCSRMPDGLFPDRQTRKAWSRYGIHLILLAGNDMEKHLALGTLFLERHCTASTLVYNSGRHELPGEELSRSMKKFRQIRQKYRFTCRLLNEEIRKAEKMGSFITAYHVYTSLFEHHLFHLEFLCPGRYFLQDTLDQRLMRLEPFFPEIRSFLLKKTGNTHYITEALLSAGKAETGKEYSHLRAEFREAVAIAGQKLHELVKITFRDIRTSVKYPDHIPEPAAGTQTASPYESVVRILTRRFPIEEIFLFRQEEAICVGRKITRLHLLLIANTITNDDLDLLAQAVLQKTGRKYMIVPMVHSAAWIQEHLWESQPFFRKAMQPENAIYTAAFHALRSLRLRRAWSETSQSVRRGLRLRRAF